MRNKDYFNKWLTIILCLVYHHFAYNVDPFPVFWKYKVKLFLALSIYCLITIGIFIEV